MTTFLPETAATLDVPLSLGRTAAVLLLFAALTTGCVLMILDPEGGRHSSDANYAIGWLGAFIFGSMVILLLWQFVTLRGPVVTLSPAGLRDRRLSPDLIPWSAVDSVYIRALNRSASILVVGLKPGQSNRFARTSFMRLMSHLSFPSRRRSDELPISTLILATGLEELRAAAKVYLDHHSR